MQNKNRQSPDRQGHQVSAGIDLVTPLIDEITAMRGTETWSVYSARSDAVSLPIDRQGDVDRVNNRSTPTTRIMPGRRTSTTATRTTSTRTTSAWGAPSADQCQPNHADFSFADLVQAYLDCRRHKRNKRSAQVFEQDQERNLVRLYDELQAGTYRPGTSICFVITRPKPREVWAADFRDRIVHHLLYNRVSPRFYASFIVDSCACIPGRGTMYGAKRLESKIRSITQNWKKPAYYLKCDLANFFVSINKNILSELLAAKIHEPWWLDLANTILFHDPRTDVTIQSRADRMVLIPAHKSLYSQPDHKGLPIGNISSQFYANVILNELDQFVKHQLRAKYYVRYVDDFIILHESMDQLNEWLAQIESFLPAKLDMQLNPKKTIRQPIARGVDFVGHVIKPWRRTLRRRTFNDALFRVSNMPAGDLYESVNSYFGLMRQASHSKRDRTRLAKIILRRGHSVNQGFTKTFRRLSNG